MSSDSTAFVNVRRPVLDGRGGAWLSDEGVQRTLASVTASLARRLRGWVRAGTPAAAEPAPVLCDANAAAVPASCGA